MTRTAATATMTTTNNLDALFADAEPPFGHPGRRFDDTSEYFDPYASARARGRSRTTRRTKRIA